MAAVSCSPLRSWSRRSRKWNAGTKEHPLGASIGDGVGYLYEEETVKNRRVLDTFTCRWLPADREPKALIFLCHGYAADCSVTMEGTGIRLAKAGYAVYGMDHIGFGRSKGLRGYIPSFDDLVDDCADYYTSVCERDENKNKKRYLYGESMGGAVVVLQHRRKPTYWDGAVLVAPMCKISDNMKPSPMMVSILTKLGKVIPTWKLVPTKDIIDTSFKSEEMRRRLRNNPYGYKGWTRLKTGMELLRVTQDIEKRLDEFTLPFIIVQGEDDTMVDPKASLQLYEAALSIDKTIKFYDGMWHGLTSGEPPENIDLVFSDIVEWLDHRVIANGVWREQITEEPWKEHEQKEQEQENKINQEEKEQEKREQEQKKKINQEEKEQEQKEQDHESKINQEENKQEQQEQDDTTADSSNPVELVSSEAESVQTRKVISFERFITAQYELSDEE